MFYFQRPFTTNRNGYISAVSARQLSVSLEKLFEWNRILCSVITAQNSSITFLMPESKFSILAELFLENNYYLARIVCVVRVCV